MKKENKILINKHVVGLFLILVLNIGIVEAQSEPHSISLLVRYLARSPAFEPAYDSPYRLREPVFQQAFTRRLLADARRGRVQFYSDSAFARPVDGRKLDRELYFLRDWLRNKPRNQAMRLPDYQCELLAREVWYLQGDSLLGFDRQFVRIDFFDAAKPELPPLRYFLKPEAIVPLLPVLLLEVDFRGNRQLDLQTLWREHDLVFSLVQPLSAQFPNREPIQQDYTGSGLTHLPDALNFQWRNFISCNRQSARYDTRPLQLVIPTGWHDLSYKPGWSSDDPQRLERSRHMVRVLAPQMLRLALTGRVNVYTHTGQRDRTARTRLEGLIDANLPGPSPRERRNARSLDYSARIFDLEVSGRWTVDATGGRFEPEWLSLVWGQRIDDPNKEVVATFRVADLRRAGVIVDGQPVDTALADWRSYYAYMFGVNDSYIQSLQQAAVVDACLRAGRVAHLPSLHHWKTLTDEVLQSQLIDCRRLLR